jgi:putative transposase
MESFFHSMKSDAVHGIHFQRQAELERLVRSYMPYHNGVRLHSGIGYSSPVDSEARTR